VRATSARKAVRPPATAWVGSGVAPSAILSWAVLLLVLSGGGLPAAIAQPAFMPELPKNRWVEMDVQCVGGLHSYARGCPTGRGWIQLAYDSRRGRVVLFGGSGEWYFNDLWYLDPRSMTWELILQDTRLAGVEKDWDVYPRGRDNHQLVYDPERDVYWMYGGTSGGGFWKFRPDAREWVRMPGDNDGKDLPLARLDPAFAVDPARHRILLFGGERWSFADETWTFDTLAETWTHLEGLSPRPAARAQTQNAMTYDTQRDQFILFGGRGLRRELYGDTWIFDPEARRWREVTPARSPPGRDGHVLTYDQKNGVAILVAGNRKAADTWIYDPDRNTWAELVGARGDYRPEHARLGSAVYIPELDITLLRDVRARVYVMRLDLEEID
jgi:hypothetical protein